MSGDQDVRDLLHACERFNLNEKPEICRITLMEYPGTPGGVMLGLRDSQDRYSFWNTVPPPALFCIIGDLVALFPKNHKVVTKKGANHYMRGPWLKCDKCPEWVKRSGLNKHSLEHANDPQEEDYSELAAKLDAAIGLLKPTPNTDVT